MRHLWEVQHPYYCSDTNYHVAGPDFGGHEYNSWRDFLDEWGDPDLDMNLLVRWDWKTPEEVMEDYDVDDPDRPVDGGWLGLYFLLQRKGNFVPVQTWGMGAEDEISVIQFLKPRFDHLKKMWLPIDV